MPPSSSHPVLRVLPTLQPSGHLIPWLLQSPTAYSNRTPQHRDHTVYPCIPASSLIPEHIQLVLPLRTVTISGVKVLVFRIVATKVGRLRPELRSTQTEIGVSSRLVPEHLVLQLVRLRVIIDDQTLEILRTLGHDLTERVEIRKHTGILFVEFAAISDDVLTKDEHVVDVRTEVWGNTDGVLHRDDEHGVDVTTVHEQIPDVAITDPAGIVQTVVQNQEVAGVHGGRAALRQILGDLLGDELLALEDVGDDKGRILLMDEHGRHHLAVELVGTLRTGDHGTTGQTLVVPQEILYEERLAGFALADQDNHLVVFDLGHVEFPQTQIQFLAGRLGHRSGCLDTVHIFLSRHGLAQVPRTFTRRRFPAIPQI
jgi:hypothetical protein